jgi:ABC-type nitrate/sulfonate/bicarbonate transport system substrate-binding protein
MEKRKKIILIAASLLAAALLIIILIGLFRGDRKTAEPVPAADLRRHPIYSAYNFSKDAGIIHFGVQPQWVFKGNMAEIMRRDLILRQSLQALGLKIRFHPFLTGKEIVFFTREGDLQGGICGDMPTLLIATSLKTLVPALSDQGFGYIVSRPIMAAGDLKGKRIGFPPASYAHHLLLDALDSEGITAEQVDLIPMKPGKMPEALEKDRIDAFAVWEPFASIGVRQAPGSAVIHRSRYLAFIYFRKDFSDNHPEAVRQILAAEIRAVRWMFRNKGNLLVSSRWAIERGREIFGKLYDVTPQDFADIIDAVAHMNLAPTIPDNDLKKNGYLHREYEFLKKRGKIPPSSDWKTLRQAFDNRMIKQVLADPVKYRLDEVEFTRKNGQ